MYEDTDELFAHIQKLINGRLLLSVDDLPDVIACDYEAYIRNATNGLEIAAALQVFIEKTVGRGTKEKPFRIGQLRTWTSHNDELGFCPFDCHLGTLYNTAEVHVLPLGVSVTARTVHLLGEHGFCGGPCTPFRLSPDDATHIVQAAGIYSL